MVPLKFKIRLAADANGDTIHVLDVRLPSGKRQRTRHDSRAAAERELSSIKEQINTAGEFFGSLTARQRSEAALVMLEAQEFGMSLRGLLDFYKTHSISNVRGKTVTLAKLVEQTVEASKNRKNTPNYTHQLHSVLRSFARGRETLALNKITLPDIEDWLSKQKGRAGEGSKASPYTLQGLRNRLSAMFSEAIRQGYIGEGENPMKKVITPKAEALTPIFLTHEQAANLLWICRATDPEWIPWLALGMFAGIRPEELEKLRWGDIDFDRERIIIEDGVSKVRMRRIIPLSPKVNPTDPDTPSALIQWLYYWVLHHNGGAFPPADKYIVPIDVDRRSRTLKAHELSSAMRRVRQLIRRHRRNLAERAKVKWENDILRKTAATYLMVKFENENLVSGWLGNSPKILHRHYRGLGRREDSEKFWAQTPDVVKNDPYEHKKGGVKNNIDWATVDFSKGLSTLEAELGVAKSTVWRKKKEFKPDTKQTL